MNESIDGKNVYDPTSFPECHEEMQKLRDRIEELEERMVIPVNRQQDMIDVLWSFLRNIECRTKETDILSRMDVTSGYRIMRDLGVTTHTSQLEIKTLG